MDCTDKHGADCVVGYMSTNHSDPDGWASFRNISTKMVGLASEIVSIIGYLIIQLYGDVRTSTNPIN